MTTEKMGTGGTKESATQTSRIGTMKARDMLSDGQDKALKELDKTFKSLRSSALKGLDRFEKILEEMDGKGVEKTSTYKNRELGDAADPILAIAFVSNMAIEVANQRKGLGLSAFRQESVPERLALAYKTAEEPAMWGELGSVIGEQQSWTSPKFDVKKALAAVKTLREAISQDARPPQTLRGGIIEDWSNGLTA
jgi:hypothetical protein